MFDEFESPRGERSRLAGAVDSPSGLEAMVEDVPSRFVLFLAADESTASPAEWQRIADGVLRARAVYVVVWGPGCTKLESHFDVAYVNAVEVEHTLVVPEGSVVMTTAHPTESLEEALWFAVHAAWPDNAYADACHATLAVAVGNREWHRRIREYLHAGAPLIDADGEADGCLRLMALFFACVGVLLGGAGLFLALDTTAARGDRLLGAVASAVGWPLAARLTWAAVTGRVPGWFVSFLDNGG